jgi:hypothetical protein
MALINDPDSLTQSTLAATGAADGEVFINTTLKTIELIATVDGSPAFSASNLVAADGVTLQALYSFLKEEWKSDAALIKFPFPMEAITSEQFEFINGWKLTDVTTPSRTYVKNAGWLERDAAGVSKREYLGAITLGNIEATHTAYFAWDGAVSKTDFTYAGPVNEAVKFYASVTATDIGFDDTSDFITSSTTDLTDYFEVGDFITTTGATTGANNGTFEISAITANQITLAGTPTLFTEDDGATVTINISYKTTVLNLFIRSAPEGPGSGDVTGWLYNKSTTTAIGATTVTYQAYRFPLAEAVDINIDKLDSETTGAPYNDMYIDYFATGQSRTIGASNYDFSVIIDANVDNTGTNPTNIEIYNYVQKQLRQAADIDQDSSIPTYGVLADPLVEFVGTTLKTLQQSNTDGVYIDDFNLDNTNNVEFAEDITGTSRKFPFSATVTLAFNDNLIADPNSKFWLFYSSVPTGDYGTTNAVLVQDDGDVNITNDIHYQALSPATGAATGTADGSATSGGFTMTVSGATWTSSNLVGQVLRVTSGLNAKSYFITANAATTITVDSDVPFEDTDAAMSWALITKNTAGTYQFTFDYEGETDGGRSADTDAPVTFIALGLNNAQFVTTTGTITKSATVNIPITSALERNYSDPV